MIEPVKCRRLGYGPHEFPIHSPICQCGERDTRTMPVVSGIARKDSAR